MKKRKARRIEVKEKTDEVEQLATSIISERTEERIEEEQVLSTSSTTTSPYTYSDTPNPIDQPKQITRVLLTSGFNALTPYVIQRHEREQYKILADLFGYNDGSYFIHNEMTQWKNINNQRKRLKTILVEDSNSFKYQLWFDVSSLSLI